MSPTKSAADVTADKIREYLANCAGSERWPDRDAVEFIFRENFAPLCGVAPKSDPSGARKAILAAAEALGKNWVMTGDHGSEPCFHVGTKGFCLPATPPSEPPSAGQRVNYGLGAGAFRELDHEYPPEPPLNEDEIADLEERDEESPMFVGVVCFIVGAMTGVFLAWVFLALE